MSRYLVHTYVEDVIITSRKLLDEFAHIYGISRSDDFASVHGQLVISESSCIRLSDEMQSIDERLHEFLKDRIINSHAVHTMDGVARYVIRRIIKAYVTNPQQLPDRTIKRVWDVHTGYENSVEYSSCRAMLPKDIAEARSEIGKLYNHDDEFHITLLRVVCDHVACMTDQYAQQEFQKLYGISPLTL